MVPFAKPKMVSIASSKMKYIPAFPAPSRFLVKLIFYIAFATEYTARGLLESIAIIL